MKDYIMADTGEINYSDLNELHSKNMKRVEKSLDTIVGIWAEVEKYNCGAAGKDRTCDDALKSALAGKMKHQAEAILSTVKAFHREADYLSATYEGAPVARSGER